MLKAIYEDKNSLEKEHECFTQTEVSIAENLVDVVLFESLERLICYLIKLNITPITF